MSVEKLFFRLGQAGLNLISVLDRQKCGELKVSSSMKSVLLIGNSGATLWDAIPPGYFERENPVDEYTSDMLQDLLTAEFPGRDWRILFPADADSDAPNLQQLGRLAGWHHASPLGNGINQKSGLWFAYRAVVAVDVLIPPSAPQIGDSPCVSCTDTPCIAACPGTALQIGEAPDLSACVHYRSEPESSCAQTCLARLACPVATHCRYSAEQIRYFYKRSLPSLQRWVAR